MLIGTPGEFGRMVADNLAMNDAERAVAQARETLSRERRVASANYRKYADAIAERDDIIARQKAKIIELMKQLDAAKTNADRDAAIIAGLDAYVRTVQELSPNCEALTPTGRKYKRTGADVTIADENYGSAFDAKALERKAPHLITERKIASEKID